MKEPSDFELKNWLVSHTVTGLRLDYYQSGDDTADTDWELSTFNKEERRVNVDRIKHLVTVKPDHVSVLQVLHSVKNEVIAYRKFVKDEAIDLAEYARLKKKLGV